MALLLAIQSASAAISGSIGATYSTIVDRHISDIMTVWNSDELTYEWTPTLHSIAQKHTRDMGELSHQQYTLPWPLAPRDMLLRCDRKVSARDARVTSECTSVVNEAVPERKGVVRMTLEKTAWQLEAVDGDRTRLTLTLVVPAAMAVGVPSFVVKYCQKSSLKDSIANLMAAVDRLQLPPHASYVGWRRTRAEAQAARASISATGHVGLISFEPFMGWALPLLGLLFACCMSVAFALLPGSRSLGWTRRKEASAESAAGGATMAESGAKPKDALRPRSFRQGLTLRLHGGLIM